MGVARFRPETSVDALSLEEALRTIGLGLDGMRAPSARFTVNTTGITVDAAAAYGVRTYSWQDLARESCLHRNMRRPGTRPTTWNDPAALTRWPVLLRVIGRLLDAQGLRDNRITAAVATPERPYGCTAQVRAGDRAVLDSTAVVAELQALRLQYSIPRTLRAAEGAERQRPWWARWRSN